MIHNIIHGVVFDVSAIYWGDSHWATAGYYMSSFFFFSSDQISRHLQLRSLTLMIGVGKIISRGPQAVTIFYFPDRRND